MRFSGYIFDVEGTLVDSVQQNLLSLQVCLADFGISIPYELLNSIPDWTATKPFSS
jgi:beta-phosphoglucomutase-like phosphatase (HAD superfamily)